MGLRLAPTYMIALLIATILACGDGGGENSSACADCAGGQWVEERVLCVEVINDFRADAGKAPLQRAADLEDCATSAAQADSRSGAAHGHFLETRGCSGTALAENEVPGWPLAWYGSVNEIVMAGAQAMYDEGPGGGHYENITGPYAHVGCGIEVTSGDEVWVVHNFR